MKFKNLKSGKWKRNSRAVSPAISTVIITSAIVVLLLVTMVFVNNLLDARVTENEFSAMEQFMQTVALQIDDVAWIPGRIQTVRYTSQYGYVSFKNATLTYSIYIDNGAGYEFFANFTTGIILFNMPVSHYSMGNNYHKRIFPQSNSTLQMGTSASTCHVFVVEKLPMSDGNYIRIVVAPCIRVLSSNVGNRRYFKFFLPILVPGSSPLLSQSVTLKGELVSVKTGTCNAVKIVVSFPRESDGFDADFFRFQNTIEILDVQDSSILEFYTGRVVVSLGLHG